MAKQSSFPNQNVTFRDTRKCGGISIQGFWLETDEDGYVEAPPALEKELVPHGFVRENRNPAGIAAYRGGRK